MRPLKIRFNRNASYTKSVFFMEKIPPKKRKGRETTNDHCVLITLIFHL